MGGAGRSIGNVVGDISGSNRAADAAQGAALAQQAEARRQRADILQRTEGVTVEGLAQYDKALQLQDKNIARQEQLLSSIDPTVLEASQQALRLLRGETSSTLAPLQQQRQMQRQKLVNSLREQLGPGAETSTAGIQALTRFDSETSQLFAGAQQQALGQLGQTAGVFSSIRPDLQQSAMGLGQLASNRAGLRYTQTGLMQGANQAALQSAGAQFTGEAIRGQAQNALFGQLVQAGGMALGGYLGGAGGALAGGAAGGAASSLPSLGGYTSPNLGSIGR